jgi:flagellar motor switch protein FliM
MSAPDVHSPAVSAGTGTRGSDSPAPAGAGVEAVAPRDFKRPRRLSKARVQELATRVRQVLPSLGQSLESSLGTSFSIDLASVSEADAAPLFESLSEPFTIARFRCNGQPGWIVWEPLAALAAVECILGDSGRPGTDGTSGTGPVARSLTRVEIRLLAQILGLVVERVSAALGVKSSETTIVAAKEDVGSWKDAPKDAEPHRLVLDLAVSDRAAPASDGTTTRSASHVILYLPGFGARVTGAPVVEGAGAPVRDLPACFDAVEVELSAALAGCEVPLSQLLALEVGDVIPCEVELGGSALVSVDGSSFARAVLGTHRGKLALRLQERNAGEELEA